jgi:putative ABC transport system permease protein
MGASFPDFRAFGRKKAIAALRYAMRSLSLHRMRAVLSTLGVVCAVISFIAMISIGEGAKRETLAQLEQLGLRNVLIRAVALTQEQERDARNRGSAGLTLADGERLKAVAADVQRVAALRELRLTVLALTQHVAPELLAISPNFIDVQRLELAQGRFITEADVWQRSLVCVLGYQVSRRLGEAGRPGGVLRIENALCRVVGVLKRFERRSAKIAAVSVRDYDNAVMLPLGAETLMPQDRDGFVSELIAQIDSGRNVIATVPLIRRVLELTHRGADDYRIVVPQELLQQALQTQTTFNIVLGSIAAISLLVGGIGIMNIMLASVSERTREIGIRRAVGATREHIVTQFLTESVILTTTGGVLGVLLGVAAVWLVSTFAGWHIALTMWALVLPLAMSVMTGLFFGLYPAIQAASVDPINALRHE